MKLNDNQVASIESQISTYKIGAYFNEDGDVVNNLLDTVKALKEQVDAQHNFHEILNNDLVGASREVQRLRKALEFYSSKGCIVQEEWLSKMYEDVAKTADEALAYGSEVGTIG